MSGLNVKRIKVVQLMGTEDLNGFRGFMAKVTVDGDFLSVDFEKEFLVSKAIKLNESIAVRISDKIGKVLDNGEKALQEAVKEWIQKNLQKVHNFGLNKPGIWVEIR